MPTQQLVQVMERAALSNYKQVYGQLMDEQEEEEDDCDQKGE